MKERTLLFIGYILFGAITYFSLPSDRYFIPISSGILILLIHNRLMTVDILDEYIKKTKGEEK